MSKKIEGCAYLSCPAPAAAKVPFCKKHWREVPVPYHGLIWSCKDGSEEQLKVTKAVASLLLENENEHSSNK